MLRPQVAARQRDGWCGSQADDPRLLPPLLPASPVTRDTTESHPLRTTRSAHGSAGIPTNRSERSLTRAYGLPASATDSASSGR